jgi:DNA-binding protein YbaB
MEDCNDKKSCQIIDKDRIYYEADKIRLSMVDKDVVWKLDKKIKLDDKSYLQLCYENDNCEYIGIVKNTNENKLEGNEVAYLENDKESIIIYSNRLFNKNYNILEDSNNIIIKNLIQTFNTNILNNIDIFEKLKIYSNVFENKDKNTLTKLIYNNYQNNSKNISNELKKPVSQFLGGPSIIVHLFSKKYLKDVYIFGESHDKDTDCSSNFVLIEDYLKRLIENTDVFIDLFVEIPVIKSVYEERKGFEEYRLIKILKTLKKCVDIPSRSDCSLSRIHYMDIRDEEGVNITPLVDVMTDIFSINRSEDKYDNMRNYLLNNRKILIEIIDKIYNSDNQEFVNYILKDLFKHKKINKELSKIKFEKSLLEEFIIQTINEKIIEVKETRKTLIKYINLFVLSLLKDEEILLERVEKSYQYIVILANILSGLLAIYVDVYTICRMFKEFDVSNIYNQPKEAHNIIVYAGSLHSGSITEFLVSNLDFKVIESVNSTDKYNNCIDMTDIIQPLFNKIL